MLKFSIVMCPRQESKIEKSAFSCKSAQPPPGGQSTAKMCECEAASAEKYLTPPTQHQSLFTVDFVHSGGAAAGQHHHTHQATKQMHQADAMILHSAFN
jgi:hypothetical protein